MSKQLAFATFAMLLLVAVGSPAMGQQVQVYNDPVRFDIQAKAPAIPIPDSQRAFPGTSCGTGIEDLRVAAQACKSLSV
jgi:hypothetical protein